MKFSTSALLAVVAFAGSASASVYTCDVQTFTDMEGTENCFGFSTDFLAECADFTYTNAEFGREVNGFTNTFSNNYLANPVFGLTVDGGGDGFPFDESTTNDITITHEIDFGDVDSVNCKIVELCVESLTWGQGFHGLTKVEVEDGNNAVPNVVIDELTDGDEQEANSNGDVFLVKENKCIDVEEELRDMLNGFGGSIPITFNTVLNTGSVPFVDDWAIDYSTLTVKVGCKCQTSETQPDPHFKTFSGDWFDFHGGCDIVLIDVPDYANQAGLAVNIRTTVRYAYSFIETLAIKVGEDILQVSGWGDYILNGISNAELEGATLNGLPVTREVISEKQYKFIVTLENGHHFTIKVYKDMISTSFDLPEEHDVRGILGDKSGAKLARDGVTIIEDANEFGQEWQVQDTDHQLFQTVREPQFPAKCIMPDPVEREKRRLSATVSQEAAEAACSHIKDEHVRDMCIFDVISVDDLSLAAGAY